MNNLAEVVSLQRKWLAMAFMHSINQKALISLAIGMKPDSTSLLNNP